MICFVCVPAWGKNWAYLALALWWTCVVLSVFINVGMVFVLFARQRQTAQTLGPTWLLPIVTTVVAAASGAVVAQTLLPYNAGLGRGTLLAAYCVWGTGVPLAMMVIALVVYRTAIYGPPEGSALASSFLPLGPCGQGSYGIIMMGTTARHLAYDFDTPIIPGLDADAARRIADAMYAGGLVVGLIMWGLALVFYLLASALFIDSWRRDWALLGRSRFAIGLWGLTFPIG
jgi:tellurite resistance protein TehA-like permease